MMSRPADGFFRLREGSGSANCMRITGRSGAPGQLDAEMAVGLKRDHPLISVKLLNWPFKGKQRLDRGCRQRGAIRQGQWLFRRGRSDCTIGWH